MKTTKGFQQKILPKILESVYYRSINYV